MIKSETPAAGDQLQHSMQLLHPLGDLLAHIMHLPVNLLINHHLNQDHHLRIALLASPAT